MIPILEYPSRAREAARRTERTPAVKAEVVPSHERLLLSIVVPLFNEAEGMEELYRRLSALIAQHQWPCEVILVNDGSRDGTLALAREICERDARFKLISFSRNFGHQIAITAGMDRASGAAVAIIDADLQDPPELIADMLARWREGYQVVYGVRRMRKGETWFKRATASMFYRLLRRMADVEIPLDAGDFRLLDRRVVDQLVGMRERARFVRGLVSWVGFRQCQLEYVREERFAGTTKYPLRRMLRFALDGMLSFSHVPLRIASAFGFLCAGVGFAFILYAFAVKLGIFSQAVPGWTSLFVAVLFVGGVQLISLGILGEYLGRIYDEIQNRPLYICDEERNFDEHPPAGS